MSNNSKDSKDSKEDGPLKQDSSPAEPPVTSTPEPAPIEFPAKEKWIDYASFDGGYSADESTR